MKTDNASLDQLFRSARQQPPLVQVQDVHRLLAQATVAAAGAGAVAASAKGAAGFKGAVVAKTAAFTSHSIAMISTVMSTAIIGSGLWLQHIYVQSGNGNQTPPPGQAVTEIPFSISTVQGENEPAVSGRKTKKTAPTEAKKATGVTYSFPGSSPLPSPAPKAGPAKAKAAPTGGAPAAELTKAISPAAYAPAVAPAAGKPGVPGTAGKSGSSPCGTGQNMSYYSTETKKVELLNTRAVSENRYLRLSPKELKELGISVTDASVEYKRFFLKMCPGYAKPATITSSKNPDALLGHMFEVRFLGSKDIYMKNDQSMLKLSEVDNLESYYLYPWYITEAEGRQRIMYKMAHEPERKLEKSYFDEVQHQLVPVVVESKHGLEGRIVFWFPISETLLAALPESASRPLREQYKAELAAQCKPAEASAKPGSREEAANPEPAISNLSSAKQIELFPNPTRNHLYLNARFQKADRVQVQLLDSKGRLVKQLQPEQQVQAGSWSRSYYFDNVVPGVYLVLIRSESGEQWNQRLVVTD